jgi:hypothetical protein
MMASGWLRQSKMRTGKGCFTRMQLRRKLPQMKVAMKKREPMKRGTKPEMLKLNGNWQAGIKKSFQKKRSATGWPK